MPRVCSSFPLGRARPVSGSMRVRAAPRVPVLLLLLLLAGLTAGWARGAPLGSAHRRWETLYSRSVARVPGEKRDAARDSDYLTGIKRLRRLYCNVGIGFHLQVLPDGTITGVHSENRYSEYNQPPPSTHRDPLTTVDHRFTVQDTTLQCQCCFSIKRNCNSGSEGALLNTSSF